MFSNSADSAFFQPADMRSEMPELDAKGPTHVLEPPPEYEQVLPPLTNTTERKLMAKIDWHILPCLCVLYLLAFLDR